MLNYRASMDKLFGIYERALNELKATYMAEEVKLFEEFHKMENEMDEMA